MAIELIEQDGMLRFSGRSVFPSRDKNALLRPRNPYIKSAMLSFLTTHI